MSKWLASTSSFKPETGVPAGSAGQELISFAARPWTILQRHAPALPKSFPLSD